MYARSDFVSLFAVFVAKKRVASSSKRSRSASRGYFPREDDLLTMFSFKHDLGNVLNFNWENMFSFVGVELPLLSFELRVILRLFRYI